MQIKNATPNWEALIDLATILSQQNDFPEILRLVAQKAASLLQAETCLILMLNPRTQDTVKTVMCEGRVGDERKFKVIQNQISGWLIQNQRPFWSADLKGDARFRSAVFGEVAVKSVLGVPLRVEGALLGTLILLNKQHDGVFAEDDAAYLEKLGVIAAPYLRNVQKIAAYFTTPLPEAALRAKYEPIGLLGKSPAFIEMLQAVEAAARCDVRVLLEGQTGTGKELVARAIHRFSSRHDKPFVAIDCGAIPANLLESELFGHVKGAFTGATQDRQGLLEAANHGTLFMDEIANLPLEMQAKFMRVLQEGEIRPVGGNQTRRLDVRFIAASSQALHMLIEQGKFREDLFYRLHVYPISLPALRERQPDIPLLAEYFLHQFARQQQKQVASFHATVLAYLKQRAWEGNIRQLENFIERLVTLAPPDMKILDAAILPPNVKKDLQQMPKAPEAISPDEALPELVAAYETRLIRQALEANAWSQSQAARQLKIPVQTLHYKINKLGIAKSE